MTSELGRCHLIAVKTMLPTLRSAREYCAAPRFPQIVASGTRAECFHEALRVSRQLNCIVEETVNLPG
jgi:hypothetical protein